MRVMVKRDEIAELAGARRILILGSSGSGKTTLALQLGRVLKLETIHLDAHFWRNGWISTPQEEWTPQVEALAMRPAWIMDGTYERTLPLRLPSADAIIVLECSRWRCLWQVVKRKLTVDDQRRPDAPPGQPLDWPFLRYVLRYPAVTRPLVQDLIRQYAADKPVIVLHGGREVQRLVQRLESSRPAAAPRDA